MANCKQRVNNSYYEYLLTYNIHNSGLPPYSSKTEAEGRETSQNSKVLVIHCLLLRLHSEEDKTCLTFYYNYLTFQLYILIARGLMENIEHRNYFADPSGVLLLASLLRDSSLFSTVTIAGRSMRSQLVFLLSGVFTPGR